MKYTPEMFKGGEDAPTIADVEGHPGVFELVAPTGEVEIMSCEAVNELIGDVSHLRYIGSVPPR